jgi:hypothetical protein
MRIRFWASLAAPAAVAVCLGGAPAAIAATTITGSDPVSGTVENTCTGDTVVIQGTSHFKFTFNSTSTGGQTEAEMNLTGVSGTAPLSGARYVMNTQSSEVSHFSFDPTGHDVEQVEMDQLLNRLGNGGQFVLGDDLYVRVLAHLTVNANGVPTVDRYSVSGDCR